METIKIGQATKKGYIECVMGALPTSAFRQANYEEDGYKVVATFHLHLWQ